MNFPENWRAFAGIEPERLARIDAHLASLATPVYPPEDCRFAALSLTPPEAVRVVILGQDPYHGDGEAHGLAFSVRRGVPVPPSLRNILKEARDDLGYPPVVGSDLTPWAEQGVLLLNAILTVEKDRAGAHRTLGWEAVTDRLIAALSANRDGLAFILWGTFARKKARLIDRSRHLVLESTHPSPLFGSCHKGFFGSRPFSKANAWLEGLGSPPIHW